MWAMLVDLEEGCGAGERLRPHGADPAVDVHIDLRGGARGRWSAAP